MGGGGVLKAETVNEVDERQRATGGGGGRRERGRGGGEH
jgi:hypothetical protein